MRSMTVALLGCALMFSGCATPVPVHCPPPPPLPEVLLTPVTAGPSWTQRYEAIESEWLKAEEDFANSLLNAERPSKD